MVSYGQWIEYMFWKARQHGVPLSGTFELTSRCNLDCKMCYIHRRANDLDARREELTTGQWLDLARVAQEKGMLLLLLTGGEPLLRSDFREIYSECRNLGLMVSLNTNGTMMTEQMVSFLADNPPQRVNLTLYGASRETYQKLCGDGNAFERAYQGVEMLRQAGIPLKLNYSMTPLNQGDVQQVYSFARERGLLMQTASYMFPPVRACADGTCGVFRLTPEEAAQAQLEYDQFRMNEAQLLERVKRVLEGKEIQDPDWECQELPTERIRCRAGSTTFWVTYDGQMRPCGMMQVPSVNIREGNFQSAWETIRQERDKIMIPDRCSSCEWKQICEFCPAASYGETGRFEDVPEYLCQKTHTYLRLAQKWMKKKIGEA